MLIENVVVDTSGDGAGGTQRLSLVVKAFVAPPAGAGAPTVTTD